MTLNDSIPAVRPHLVHCAFVVSDYMDQIRDLEGAEGAEKKRSRLAGLIKAARNRAKKKVRQELESAGRTDLQPAFDLFIDKHTARADALTVIDKLFTTNTDKRS